METAQLLLCAILFMGAVYGDENATTVSEKPEITVVHPNAINIKSKDHNVVTQTLEDLVAGLNDSSENPEEGEINTTEVTAEDVLPNSINPERVSDKPDKVYSNVGWEFENKTPVETRRILNGKKVQPGARPYMVYLNLTEKSLKAKKTKGWLCGGVIVHKEYVITSAACVEDGDKFYVISGTVEYKSAYNNNTNKNGCVTKNQRRVIWKCVPKYYNFSYLDDVKWSANDIAVVKVDRPFKLGEVEEGCQFAAEMVPYNDISRELEEPGTRGYILGWGSIKNFREQVYRKQNDGEDNLAATLKKKNKGKEKDKKDPTEPPYKCLQEAKVVLMDKDKCAAQWPSKFRDIITEFMICTEDIEEDDISAICSGKYANCTVVNTRRELELPDNQTVKGNLTEAIDSGRHLGDNYTSRRGQGETGGFCEYDHGGPLVVRYRGTDHVVGVISVCRVDTGKTLCHGPFLYTSVFKNRQFLSCSIQKDIDDDCRRVFRSGLTHEEWTVDWDDEQ